MLKKMGPAVPTTAIDFYSNKFKSANAGAEFTLAAVPGLYQATLMRELKGRFTAGQLKMFVDVMNGTFLTAGLAGQHMQANVEDSFALYPGMYEEKWDIDRTATEAALKELTAFQRAVLEIWVASFWLDPDQGLEKYVAVLAKP